MHKKLLLSALVAAILAFYASPAMAYPQEVSWYGYSPVTGASDGSDGSVTASGEMFDSQEYTCAAGYDYPFGTLLKITYEGRSVICRVNDTGDYQGRWDLSYAAAKEIGLADAADVAVVDVEVASQPE
ncbi:MAG TPA: septal ring lytic transglycosylase RlpA family protein [Rubrobacteraceae bacterium]|nr:septal ring lytic transglycosylase RlpA family protein [Rubrobacteraceae bacterium]